MVIIDHAEPRLLDKLARAGFSAAHFVGPLTQDYRGCLLAAMAFNASVRPLTIATQFYAHLQPWERHSVERILANTGAVYLGWRDSILRQLSLRSRGDMIRAAHDAEVRAGAVRRWFKGNGAGRVMLVGERPNCPWSQYRYAFAGRSHSSAWLHETLERTGHPEAFYLTNAVKSDASFETQVVTLLHEIELIKPTAIIALGKVAARHLDALIDANVNYFELPHPQYVKRFHHARRGAYVRKLKTYGGLS